MIASPPIETAVETPESRCGQRGGDLGRHAAGTGHHADHSGLVGLGRILRRTTDSAHLADVGDDQAEAVGADDPGTVLVGELDHLGDVAARDAFGDDDQQLDSVGDCLDHRVLGESGGDGDDRAVDRTAVVLDRLGDGVEYRHAVDLAALAARGHAADDLRAVVEAFAGQVDRLASGDSLDDEGRVFVEEDAHAEAPWILATARPAASQRETVRSQYSTP